MTILITPYTYRDRNTRQLRRGFRALRNGNVLTHGVTNRPRVFASEQTARRFLGRDWPGETLVVEKNQ